MRHRATIYSVRVHKRYKPTDEKPFGDIDGNGTYLADFLEGVFKTNFESVSDDDQKDVRCETCTLDEPDLEVMLSPGERGIRADIMDEAGQLQLRQEPRHTQILQCGSLFRLPRNDTTGWWITHVNNGRSVKGLVEWEITRQFRETFDGLALKITPAVSSAALKAALDHDRLQTVRLFKHDQASDIADRGKWVRADSGLKLELEIKAEKGSRLIPTLVRKYLAGNAGLGQITGFEGMSFDSAKVEVELDNGDHRTFNIETPESGHAMSQDIYPEMDGDGDLDSESLFDELRTVIDDI